jgi:diguanylate cyclase (GGDEF)-like protein/PAS domain S-box-containing protein
MVCNLRGQGMRRVTARTLREFTFDGSPGAGNATRRRPIGNSSATSAGRHMSSHAPLRRTLSLQFALVGVAPLILVGLLLAFLIAPQVVDHVENRNRTTATELASRVKSYLYSSSNSLGAINSRIMQKLGNSSHLNRMLDEYLIGNDIFETIYLADSAGQVISVGLPAARQHYHKNYLGLDLSQRPFFIEARTSGRPSWSDMFLSAISGHTSVALAIPSDKYTLIGEININRFSAFLSQIVADEPIIAIIVDRHGQIIALPDTYSILQQNYISQAPLLQAGTTGRFQLAERDMIGSVVSLSDSPWSILVGVSSAYAYEKIHPLGYILISGIIAALIFALATSLMLARRLASRFEDFTGQARLIARGHYAILPQSSGIREINNLAESLRGMSVAIQDREHALTLSEAKYRDMVEGTEDLVTVFDPSGTIRFINHSSLQVIGVAPQESIGRSVWEFVHPDDRTSTEKLISRWTIQGTKSASFENRLVSLSGQIHYMLWSVTISRNEAGAIIEFSCIGRDTSERRKADEELQLAAMVYQDSSEAMMITDGDSKILAVNPAFEAITGYQAANAIGKNPNILKSGRHGKDIYQNLWHALNTVGYWQGEMWNRRKNGDLFAALITINTTFNADGTVHRRVALFSDITSRKQSEEMLWQQANFDSLTGLPNRSLFRDHLNQEIRKAKRTGIPMALMFLDLDGFKYVNDTLGHDMGDVLLKAAAERLNSCIRESDSVARLGGDEFTVILSELHEPGSVERAARTILQKLAEPFSLGDEKVYVSASIGITLYPEDAVEIEDLLKNADQAMYAAKHEGRNRYHYFTASMQEAAQVRMRLVNDLRVALEGNQFEVVYQPIVELSSGIIHKAEALIRWRHPTRGMINPLEFIPLAEDTGMIVSFGNWVFHEAARQAAQWRERHHPGFQISVNISPVQFRNEGIDSSTWFEHLNRLGLPAQGIVVEITEGLLLEATEKVTEQLLRFRDAGIEVALDDFGVGYSSLSYLKKFDIDYLKIDQSFVRNLTQESDDLALCEAIIVMAHKLGIKVIAEGVETIEQRILLAEAECDYAQGYYFSQPVTAAQMEYLLSNNMNTSNLIPG